MSKVYYGPENTYNSSYRISPSPTINISTQFNYSNDIIIGYSYIIDLTGFIFNYKASEDVAADPLDDPNYGAKHLSKNMERIEEIRKLLTHNGYNLTIFNISENNTETKVLVAKGGLLKSLSFDKSDDGWSTRIPFTASIEFVELEFLSENITCNSIDFLNTTSNVTNLQHKIKQYNDNWSFDISDESFNFHDEYHNMIINVSYNISVVGKNYVNDTNGQLMPAHEQARLFGQKMLHNRVNAFHGKTLFDTDPQFPCGTETLSTMHHHTGESIITKLRSSNGNSFESYNENIKLNISESDGSFSASYSCILKSNAFEKRFSRNDVIHNVTKSIQRNSTSKDKTNVSISVNGTVQGLASANIFTGNGTFDIPNGGSYLIQPNNPTNKHNTAVNFYETKIGSTDDLTEEFKDYLEINYSTLELEIGDCEELLNEDLKPRSFSLTHDYNAGTISYNASYDAETVCSDTASSGSEVISISINRENPVDVLAETIIPNNGVYIQDIGTKTSKKITINITGNKTNNNNDQERLCCGNSGGLTTFISGIFEACSDDELFSVPSGIPIPSSGIILSKQKNINALDGSYTANITYMCAEDCV